MISPGRPPLSFVVIEFRRSSLWSIRPWLCSDSIFEITVSSANCQVENQIEFGIERSTFILWILPRVFSISDSGFLPVTLLTVVNFEDFVLIGIDVSVDLLIVPIKTINMESIGQSSLRNGVFSMSFLELVGEEIRASMHGRAKWLRSSSCIFGIANVSSRFHDVDFSTCWPLTVLVVPREHPNGRPQPISFWEFCFDLNSSEFEVDGVDSG